MLLILRPQISDFGILHYNVFGSICNFVFLTFAASRELLAKEGEAARKEMILALKARKDALEERLKERLADLKKICVQEAVSHMIMFVTCRDATFQVLT